MSTFSSQFSWVLFTESRPAAAFCLIYPDHLQRPWLVPHLPHSRIRKACAHLHSPRAVTVCGVDLAALARTDQLEKRLGNWIRVHHNSRSLFSVGSCREPRGPEGPRLAAPAVSYVYVPPARNQSRSDYYCPDGVLSDGSIANLCSRWPRTRTPHDHEKEEHVRVPALAR